jgi:hypothetical protein
MSKIQEKLKEAVLLCKNKKDGKIYSKGLKILDDICMNINLDNKTRIASLKVLREIDPVLANDKIARFRDALMFLDDEQKENEIDLLVHIVKEVSFSCHERLMSAVCLFNNGCIDRCYECFVELANDVSVLIMNRVEATRYLLYSEDNENIKIVKRCLLGIVKSKEYDSFKRYNIIASFISKAGLRTIFNNAILNVSYNEPLLALLQKAFFSDEDNDSRSRILSGQWLLQSSQEATTVEEKTNIGEKLLDIANGITIRINKKDYDDDKEMEEDIKNIKADSADVILRLGTPDQRNKARDIINILGISSSGGLSNKIGGVYNNAQNVHDDSISESVNVFIDKIILENTDMLDDFSTVQAEVTDLVYNSNLKTKARNAVFKALNRIAIDTATFTKSKVSMPEIFQHVWMRIKKNSRSEELKMRLIEELSEMSATCSSGHAARLVNVFSGFDDTIKISWETQVVNNVSARFNARLKNLNDNDLKETIIMGMMESADKEDKDAYLKFIVDNTEALRIELYKEFVEEGYLRKKEFEEYFNEGIKKLSQ